MRHTVCIAFWFQWLSAYHSHAQFSGSFAFGGLASGAGPSRGLQAGTISGYLDPARLGLLPTASRGLLEEQSQIDSNIVLARERTAAPSIGLSRESGDAPDIPQLQEQALRDPRLDVLCPGTSRSSTHVGGECWRKLWEFGGCKPENAPEYEQWHQMQSLEVLMADVVQWAHLPDERHRQGCHGSAGPPPSQPLSLPPGDSNTQPHFERGPSTSSARSQAVAIPISRQEDLVALLQRAGMRPVILEFWNEACGFCNIMLPVFELLAEKYQGRAYFSTVDTQTAPEIATMFRVFGLPAFKAVLNGQLVQEVDGADTAALERLVEQVVGEADRQDPGGSTGASVDVGLAVGSSRDDRASSSAEALGDDELIVEIRVLQKELWRRQAEKAKSVGNPCSEARASRTDQSAPVEQVVVLGGGPAGLSAALYTARAGLCPVVVAPLVGGQLMAKGVNVENYPGVIGTRGASIIQDMRVQAQSFFADLRDDLVLSADLSSWPYTLRLNKSMQLHTRALIVATGADSRWLGVKGESELRGFGVSSCAACDGPLFWNKRCVVIGGGDTAMEEALLLARICATVTVIHRRNKLRAGYLLQQRVLSTEKIKLLWNSEVQEFLAERAIEQFAGDNGRRGAPLAGLLVRDVQTGLVTQLDVDAAFVAIGHDPNTKMFQGQLRMSKAVGYLETGDRSSQTSLPGVFAAGDVADPTYRQAVTSAGSGAMAAMEAERWLSMQGDAPADVPTELARGRRSEL